jgi:hypothetical protein
MRNKNTTRVSLVTTTFSTTPWLWLAAIVMPLLCQAVPLRSQVVAHSAAEPIETEAPLWLTEDQAREEIDIAVNHITSTHPDPFWYRDKAIWDEVVARLKEHQGPVSIGDHYFHLASIFSLTTDTHTQVYPAHESSGFEATYAVRFRSFADGLYILAADRPYEAWIGKRVASIGGMPTADVMTRLSRYVSADHPGRKKTLAEFLLIMPETYRFLGLANESGSVELLLEDPQGTMERALLDATSDDSFAKVHHDDPLSFGINMPDDWMNIYDVFGVEPPPSRRQLRNHYWYTYFPMPTGKQAAYMQINANSDNPEGEGQFDFILRAFQDIRARGGEVERFVLDLRYDLGGWINNTAALPRLLYGGGFARPGKTVVLIGRESVSAGSILAADIEMNTKVTFIGEPSGSKSNMFLYHERFELPYSKFYAESATEKDIVTSPDDHRRYLAPDIVVEESFSDFISGKDNALQAALEMTTKQAQSLHDGLYLGEGWQRASQAPARGLD